MTAGIRPALGETLRLLMRNTAQTVAIVTAPNCGADNHGPRGATSNSHTSVSLSPPIFSFCIKPPSRLHDAILANKRFAINFLSDDQTTIAQHFATPLVERQFTEDIRYRLHNDPRYVKQAFSPISEHNDNVIGTERVGKSPPWTVSSRGWSVQEDAEIIDGPGIPILKNSIGALVCTTRGAPLAMGDHFVWFGDVRLVIRPPGAPTKGGPRPLLYWSRRFCVPRDVEGS
eukprot:Clim_evm8s35 gene=Clim_evmTU8s35